MKRKQFRLGSVLRHYEVRKQNAEYDLQQASNVLRAIDAEIARLDDDLAAASRMIEGNAKAPLSMAGWMAVYRQAEHLSKLLIAARARRLQQQAEVTRRQAELKKWAVAEEALVSLRHEVLQHNRTEAAKAQQLAVDEAVLRRWLGLDPGMTPEFDG
jgi:flagellar export protein FliJ